MAPLSPCFLGTMMKAMMSASTTFVESWHREFSSMSKLVSYSVEHEFALWVWNWFSSKTFEPSQVTPSLIRPLNGLHVLASSKHGASVEINKSGFTPQDTKTHKVDKVVVTIWQLPCFCEDRTIQIQEMWLRWLDFGVDTKVLKPLTGKWRPLLGKKRALLEKKRPLSGKNAFWLTQTVMWYLHFYISKLNTQYFHCTCIHFTKFTKI